MTSERGRGSGRVHAPRGWTAPSAAVAQVARAGGPEGDPVELVQDVEEGFDSEFVWEYANMLRCRGWPAEAWPVFTDRIRAERQAGLDALDARFQLATVPLHGQADDARWHSRRPLLIVGDTLLELPGSWVL